MTQSSGSTDPEVPILEGNEVVPDRPSRSSGSVSSVESDSG